MSIATMEEEIVGVSVRLNQAIRQHFQNIVIHSFEFPGAWVDTSRLDHHLLWLLTGISEGKILFLARSMWNM